MKQGTTPILRVKIPLVISGVSTVKFLFAQECTSDSRTKLEKVYPSDEVTYDGEYFRIAFTEDETRMFVADQFFYMDTKIELTDGHIPATNIVKLHMNRTLFEVDDNE